MSQPWVWGLLLAFVAMVVLVSVPWKLHIHVQGRGEPDGRWALALGSRLGPLALSGGAASGVQPLVQVHLFGRNVITRRGPFTARARGPAPPLTARFERTRHAFARWTRWFDPVELLLFLLRERRRVRLDRLEVDVRLSLRDVALTGRVLGALAVLDGLLPPPLFVRGDTDWASENRARATLAGVVRFWPFLVMIDALVWLVRNVRVRAPREAAGRKAAS